MDEPRAVAGVDAGILRALFKPGYYRHYKGGLYKTAGLCTDSTNGRGQAWMVAYVSCTPDGQLNAEIEPHVRLLTEWAELVHYDSGAVCLARDCRENPHPPTGLRFQWVASELGELPPWQADE